MNDHRHYIPSKHFGDRHPRTMNEAFGPYAELEIDSRKLPGTRLVPYAICVIPALYFTCLILYHNGYL